jgi:hypothetical protein
MVDEGVGAIREKEETGDEGGDVVEDRVKVYQDHGSVTGRRQSREFRECTGCLARVMVPRNRARQFVFISENRSLLLIDLQICFNACRGNLTSK